VYFLHRFLKNMLLFALWFSRHKPLMSTYLRPLVDAVNTLLVKGNNCALTSLIIEFGPAFYWGKQEKCWSHYVYIGLEMVDCLVPRL